MKHYLIQPSTAYNNIRTPNQSKTITSMKTHMKNTKALQLHTKYDGLQSYQNHQHIMAKQEIKPAVETRRKQQIKIVNNNKVQLNTQPLQLVNKLFKNILDNKYKSTIDNKEPKCYGTGKKILKDRLKKNPKENYIQQEHQRELRSQANRIKNCKSLAQRKKDNTDPIVNPTYFMREGSQAQEVTIQGFKKTVLKKNRPVSAVPASQNPSRKQIQTDMYRTAQGQSHDDFQTYTKLGSVPNMSKSVSRPSKGNKQKAVSQTVFGYSQKKVEASDDLPKCTFRALLDHIVDNKMFRDVDLKVLYVRLCHRYGEERVDELWDGLMDELER